MMLHLHFFRSGKFSNLRLTGLAVSNAFDEKVPMFVIGRSPNPHQNTSNQFHASTKVREEAGWTVR